MKVFLYIRVACADQLAAADQREELERYAKDKGYPRKRTDPLSLQQTRR